MLVNKRNFRLLFALIFASVNEMLTHMRVDRTFQLLNMLICSYRIILSNLKHLLIFIVYV